METGETMRSTMPGATASVNPFMANYQTSDGGTINLCIVSPTGYIRDTFEHLGLPELADDPRFCDVLPLIENAEAGVQLIAEPIAAKPFEAFVRRLERPVVALAVVPDLGLQENVRPVADALADAFLIAIDCCGIDQPIADIERGLDRLGGVGIVDLVSAEA